MPGIEEPISIHNNFFLIVSQNELGRNQIPLQIESRLRDFNYPEAQDIKFLCKEINQSFYCDKRNQIIKDEDAETIGSYML